MINIAFFTNNKILLKDDLCFWSIDLSPEDMIITNIQKIEKSVGFSINYIEKIDKDYYIAHIDRANIIAIEKYKKEGIFQSLKKIPTSSDLNISLIESIKKYYKDAVYNFDFVSGDYPTNQINTQVFGFCLNESNECCLVRDEGEDNWTLPGGGCEFGEYSKDAFIREVREEAQMSISNIEILGYILVRIWRDGLLIEEITQARFASKTDVVEDFVVGKNNDFETAERQFVKITDLDKYIDWLSFDSGKKVFESFMSYLLKTE